MLVKRLKRESDFDTFKFYHITLPEWMECPKVITDPPVGINGKRPLVSATIDIRADCSTSLWTYIFRWIHV